MGPLIFQGIIALPSGGIRGQQIFFFKSAGVTYVPSLVSFGVYSGSEKCDHFVSKNNRDLAGQDLLRPKSGNTMANQKTQQQNRKHNSKLDWTVL